MDFEVFLNKYYGNSNKTICASCRFFLSQVENMIDDAKQTLGENASEKEIYSSLFRNREQVLKLMYSFNVKHKKFDIGMYKSTVLKKFLLNFIEWLNDQGLVDNYEELKSFILSFNLSNFLVEENLSQIYFENISEVLKFIDDVGEFYLSKVALKSTGAKGYDKNSELLNIKTVAILAWHGLTPTQMLQIKKTDIKSSNGNYFIEWTPRTYVSKIEYNILHSFAGISSYRGIPSGRLTTLTEGDELLRICSTAKSQATDKYIFNMIKRFNRCAENSGKTKILQPKALSRCGVFSQVHDFCKNNPDGVNQAIKKICNCSNYAMYYHKCYYDKWINIFYPEN